MLLLHLLHLDRISYSMPVGGGTIDGVSGTPMLFEEAPVATRTGHVEQLQLLKSPIQTRIFLSPIGHPSVLGLTGFFASTWIVSTYLCGWYGHQATTPSAYLFFVMFMGGIGQAIAGLFAFHARDDAAIVVHWTWGSFFIYHSLEDLLRVMNYLPAVESRYAADDGVAMVFATLMALTWVCVVAFAAREAILLVMTVFLATGATLAVPGFHYGSEATIKAAGYFFMVNMHAKRN